MPAQFVHLHNHTEYSLLDGATRISDMVSRAKELDMPALAISDHGVMFGAMEFYFECVKQGIKPIIGMEAYVAPGGLHNKAGREESQTYHLLLLAKNEEGYRNLCKLHTIAAMQGFYYKPRIDHEVLRKHARGLIGTSTCLGSEINQEILAGRHDRAQYLAGMYKEIFDEGSYFIELQDHGLKEQREVNERLVQIARDIKVPLIATNDAHYLCKGDAEAHDVMLCIGTGSLLQDEKRLRFETQEFFIKSRDEMAALFPDHPEALENTLQVAEMCELQLGTQRAMMPDPDLPEGATPASHLRSLAASGLRSRVPNADTAEHERLDYELGVIEQTGFESYFLLVREFAQFTHDQGIAFGVRGSAAGSLVSYCLGITDVNPIEYDLTFERFLNPERVSMPDIDMDFEDARRDEVIRWVSDKYGQDRVAQIVTFGTLGPKAALRDAGRVMGYQPIETDRLCKTIPTGPGWTLERALREVAEFRAMVEQDGRMRRLVDTAKRVEGLARHSGVHAAGVVISNEPLSDYIPLYRSNDGQAVTAYEMGILEKIGLLKMDFLGLSNLTVISRTIENIRETFGAGAEGHPVLKGGIGAIPLDDEKTFEMLGRGDTMGVFQLESGGMKRNIVELKPQSVRELAAMVALYRPGPMEHIPRYVDSKFGRAKPEYLHELMRPILEETYGVIVYQDQVLKIVQALAGFSLGRADILRRAMGKKDREIMDSMRTEFLEGCAANSIGPDVADKVWQLLLPFAGYAFNKAHAVCYAIIAYQTAYLKANYPAEYMAAILAVYRTKEDRVTAYIEECRHQRIQVLPPDINRSQVDFTVEPVGSEKAIRFGLGAIKGVGDGLVRQIIADREGKPFVHLYEFADRSRAAGLNKTALEALIRAGALDCIDKNRATLLEHSEAALTFADFAVRHRAVGQDSLFGESQDAATELSYPELPSAPAPSRSDILAMEKETLGIYVSDHPLRGFEAALSQHASHLCSSIGELDDLTPVKVAGVVAGVREIVTRSKGEKMATIVLEDMTGPVSCTVFPSVYARSRQALRKDSVVSIRGTVSHRERPGSGERTIEIKVDEVTPIQLSSVGHLDTDESVSGTVIVRVRSATKTQLSQLRDLIEANPGPFQVLIEFGEAGTQPILLLHRVDASPDVVRQIQRTLDRGDVDVVPSVLSSQSPVGTGEPEPLAAR